MRLIDADELCKDILDGKYWDNADEDVFWEMVQDAPTVDAVPVVRCKDCKHLNAHSAAGDNFCFIFGENVTLDFFCADGERKEET